MNYFEHHIGDYAEATSHLSFVEDAAYSRCIRKYYAKEQPLPADVKAVQRLVGARTKEEKDAVETVLAEFFVLTAEGWRNTRCDEDIARYVAGEPEREAKKANEETRVRRHREERAALFQKLTAAGQHAAWNIGIKELRALVDALPATAAASTPVTQPVTAPATPATATQTPDTSHHTQTPELKNTIGASAPSGTVIERRQATLDAIEEALPVEVAAIEDGKAARQEYPADFEAAWALYPARYGGNPKKESFKHWNARRREGVSAEDMLAGVERYAAYCAAAGKVGTEFVMQGPTFFGTSKRYAEQWSTVRPNATVPNRANQASTKFHFSDLDYASSVAAAEQSRARMGVDLSNIDENDPINF